MPQLKVKKAFSWAHQNVHIKDYVKGDVIETEDEDLIRVATEEGWVDGAKAGKEQKEKAPPETGGNDTPPPDAGTPPALTDVQPPAQ